jgi:hypothetical protein
MVEAGQWGRGDDKRLITSLAAAGADEAFQVDWGSLVPGRTAEQVRRWADVILQQQQQAQTRPSRWTGAAWCLAAPQSR